MSLFRELESRVSVAIDAMYGDEITIFPRTKGKYSGRQVTGEGLTVVGIVDVNPITVRIQDENAYDGFSPTIPGEKAHVSFDLSLFASPLLYPEAGDLLMTPVEGFERLEISGDPLPDGLGRIVCLCRKAN